MHRKPEEGRLERPPLSGFLSLTSCVAMTEANIQAALTHFEADLRSWLVSQHAQTDAYAFEESFAAFVQATARKTFELAVEPGRKGRNHQKK